MSRYFSRPKADRVQDDFWDDERPMIPHLSVADHEAVDTGLLDHRGDTVWRAPNPVGFGRDKEW